MARLQPEQPVPAHPDQLGINAAGFLEKVKDMVTSLC